MPNMHRETHDEPEKAPMNEGQTTSDAPSTAALVLFSGGQDSTVCLAWALERYARVETIGFDYGQRHCIELELRPQVLEHVRRLNPLWRERLGADRVLDLSTLGEISETALTRERHITMSEAGLPSTFVPGRNILFFAFAAALAYRRGVTTLIGGMCETDFSGYPDCRHETLQTLAKAIALGTELPLRIETPLMWLSKAQTWSLAGDMGGEPLIELIVEKTHSCYLGARETRHDWGYGCGTCPACELRAKGYGEWRGHPIGAPAQAREDAT